jgi:hypothetical protein
VSRWANNYRNKKKFDRAQVLDRIAQIFIDEGLSVECWKIGHKSVDRQKVKNFVSLAAVEVTVPIFDFNQLITELRQLALGANKDDSKSIKAVIDKLNSLK